MACPELTHLDFTFCGFCPGMKPLLVLYVQDLVGDLAILGAFGTLHADATGRGWIEIVGLDLHDLGDSLFLGKSENGLLFFGCQLGGMNVFPLDSTGFCQKRSVFLFLFGYAESGMALDCPMKERKAQGGEGDGTRS